MHILVAQDVIAAVGQNNLYIGADVLTSQGFSHFSRQIFAVYVSSSLPKSDVQYWAPSKTLFLFLEGTFTLASVCASAGVLVTYWLCLTSFLSRFNGFKSSFSI